MDGDYRHMVLGELSRFMYEELGKSKTPYHSLLATKKRMLRHRARLILEKLEEFVILTELK